MTKNNTINSTSSSNLKYYFIAAAVATAIAGIVHLYMPLDHPRMFQNIPNATFFLGSGIAQLFWIIPMIRRWGKIWYYIGIAGNVAFIFLYVITRIPGNPVNRREGDVDIVDLTCEIAQVAFIAITSIIIAKENRLKRITKKNDNQLSIKNKLSLSYFQIKQRI